VTGDSLTSDPNATILAGTPLWQPLVRHPPADSY
jgi:hypothetical protein